MKKKDVGLGVLDMPEATVVSIQVLCFLITYKLAAGPLAFRSSIYRGARKKIYFSELS